MIALHSREDAMVVPADLFLGAFHLKPIRLDSIELTKDRTCSLGLNFEII